MPTKLPRATYRVQLRPGFGFAEAAEIAGYLADLGVSHFYASPILQAAHGSTHGYDVIDPTRVNEELGGAAGYARLSSSLREHGLGQVLDIVPNHMAISSQGGEPRNVWWWDVLENGPSSRWAGYFDVDWDPPQSRLRNTVLLPVLGDHYGRVLEAGELRLVRCAGKFEIHYFAHRMPVAPRSLDRLLAAAAERCASPDLAFIADSYGQLPLATDRASSARRHRDKEVLAGQLARLCAERPEIAAAVDAVVAETNADPDRLDALLERQSYRPAFWRTARELDYRRFFDVHTLIGLRTEDERVFADVHALVLDQVRRGRIDGLRIDHPDGLRDPGQYFARLRTAAPDAWIVAEKILETGEPLPEDWPVDGTTGYDFLSRVGGLFVDPAGEGPLTALYTELTGQSTDWPALVREKKLLVLRELLASDVNRLAEVFLLVCERHRRYRDFTRFELRQALAEAAACFPVYRTYLRPAAGMVSPADARFIEEAVAAARENRPDLPGDLFDFFRALLLLQVSGEAGGPEEELVMRFQQLTGPAMAKGVEDTAFYNFHRLVSLNEVGGDPGRFGISLEDFHRECAAAGERWPRTMTATSTHDTKRSEDVRLRIHLLSEIPERWSAAVRRWLAGNERHRTDDRPDPNTEYLLYQTLVGAWPLSIERAVAAMEKAAREAKAFTSWTRVDEGWEAALRRFVEGALADAEFTADLQSFVAPLIEPGRISSLAQTLLRLTAPGVPDTYQGTELWDLSLVDPDNRRPVDYELRRRLLADLQAGLTPEAILARMDEGLPKLWVLHRALELRRRLPGAFAGGCPGDYRPLAARGERAAHAVAFARGGEVVAVAPRLVMGLGGGRKGDWKETVLDLPPGAWRNELTGETIKGGEVRLAALLDRFPVALLARGA